MTKFAAFVCVCSALLVNGCGSKDAPATKEVKSKDGKVTKVDWKPFSDEAPHLEYDDTTELPPLDNGRINVQMIKEWRETNQRRPGVQFVLLRGGKSYPALIMAKPEEASELTDLDETSKQTFLDQVTKATTEKYKAFLLDKPRLIDINGYPWVFYRVKMTSTTEKLEVPFLTTVAKGRRYTLEMRAIEKQANADWPALLTLAHGIKFGVSDKPAATESKDPTTEKEAADKKPASSDDAVKSGEPAKE